MDEQGTALRALLSQVIREELVKARLSATVSRAPHLPVPRRRVGYTGAPIEARDKQLIHAVNDESGDFVHPGTGELYNSDGARLGFQVEVEHGA